MNPRRLSDDSVAIAEMLGLLVECPLHGGNPATCQLHHVRELPLHERYEWAKGLAMSEAQRIRVDCGGCMGKQRAAWGLGGPPAGSGA